MQEIFEGGNTFPVMEAQSQPVPNVDASRAFDLDFLIDKLLQAQDNTLGTTEIFGPYQENLAIIHTCIRVWIDSAINCMLIARRNKGNNVYEEDDETKYYESIFLQPNNEDHYTDFIEKMFRSLAVYGEVFLRNFYMNSRNDDKIRESYVITPRLVKSDRDNMDGRIRYTYDGKPYVRKRRRPGITHIKMNSSAGTLRGISTLLLLNKEVKAARLALEHTKETLKNGGTSRIGLKRSTQEGAPYGVSNIQNKVMTEDAKEQTTGPQSIGRYLKIPDGYDVIELPISEDAEFLLTNKALKDDIAAAFGIPPHRYNNLDKANLNNIRVTENHFYKNTMMPLFQRVTCGIMADWLPSETDIKFSFDSREAFRAVGLEDSRDLKLRMETGRLTMNELRAMDGYPPFKDPFASQAFPLVELEAKIAAGRVNPNSPSKSPSNKDNK